MPTSNRRHHLLPLNPIKEEKRAWPTWSCYRTNYQSTLPVFHWKTPHPNSALDPRYAYTHFHGNGCRGDTICTYRNYAVTNITSTCVSAVIVTTETVSTTTVVIVPILLGWRTRLCQLVAKEGSGERENSS